MKTKKIELTKNDMDLIAIALLGEMSRLTSEAVKELNKHKNCYTDEYNNLMTRYSEMSSLYFDEFSVEKCTL